MDYTFEVEDFIQVVRHSWWTNLIEPTQRQGVMRGMPATSLLQWQILQMSAKVIVIFSPFFSAYKYFGSCLLLTALFQMESS